LTVSTCILPAFVTRKVAFNPRFVRSGSMTSYLRSPQLIEKLFSHGDTEARREGLEGLGDAVPKPLQGRDAPPLTRLGVSLSDASHPDNETSAIACGDERAGFMGGTVRILYVSPVTIFCRVFEELPETVDGDIEKLLEQTEEFIKHKKTSQDDSAKEKKVEISGSDQRDAEGFGKHENLIDEILKDFEKSGLIGEENNKVLSYLVMTSRKTPEPLSLLILSSSGAGKTALQDTALSFCPPEDLVKLTNLSGKALFYKERTSLKHKVLALEEGAGAEDAAYAIRNLISSEGLTSEVAVRDPASGELTTMSNTVEGPTSVFCTTTDPEVDPETRSRFLVSGIDESREQTRRILEFRKSRHSLDGMKENLETCTVRRKHQNFQRLLKPYKIVNPFVDELNYADDRLQGRRAQPQYLNIINAVAFLHQMQKEVRKTTVNNEEVEYIEVSRKDIETGHKIASEVLGKSLDELSIPSRNLLEQVEKMVNERICELRERDQETLHKISDITFTRRQIREFSGWKNTRLHTHLKELIAMEYVILENGRTNSLQHYRLIFCSDMENLGDEPLKEI